VEAELRKRDSTHYVETRNALVNDQIGQHLDFGVSTAQDQSTTGQVRKRW
jgi:hypothetical protein